MQTWQQSMKSIKLDKSFAWNQSNTLVENLLCKTLLGLNCHWDIDYVAMWAGLWYLVMFFDIFNFLVMCCSILTLKWTYFNGFRCFATYCDASQWIAMLCNNFVVGQSIIMRWKCDGMWWAKSNEFHQSVGEANVALTRDKLLMSFTFNIIVIIIGISIIVIMMTRNFIHILTLWWKSTCRDEEKDCGLDSPRKVLIAWIPFNLLLLCKYFLYSSLNYCFNDKFSFMTPWLSMI